MADRSRSEKFLLDLMQKAGNDVCADCGSEGPEWASHNIGIFICADCAGVHRSLGAHISKVKSIKLDNWDEDQLKIMEAVGNISAKGKYERLVPSCYRRPEPRIAQPPNSPSRKWNMDSMKPLDPFEVLREQWIRGKYERLEFTDIEKQTYLIGKKEGYLWKRGRDDKRFLKRKFVLNENDNTLKYFVKETGDPKNTIPLDKINAILAPEKIGNPNGLQLTYIQDGNLRNLFIYAEEGKDLIDWYTAVRSAKLKRYRIAYPLEDDDNLIDNLTRDLVKEGWLSKTGPRSSDAFRKRWFVLDKRTLYYYEDPLDANPKGQIFIGSGEKGFQVKDGIPVGTKHTGFPFTLKTPDRKYLFTAETEEDQLDWMELLKKVTATPLTIQDTSSNKF